MLDECHLLTDPYRGAAWTRAALGVQCADFHVCGLAQEGVAQLLERLGKECGDVIAPPKHYQRLSPLAVDDRGIVDTWDQLRERDCVVSFSRRSILQAKHQVFFFFPPPHSKSVFFLMVSQALLRKCCGG